MRRRCSRLRACNCPRQGSRTLVTGAAAPRVPSHGLRTRCTAFSNRSACRPAAVHCSCAAKAVGAASEPRPRSWQIAWWHGAAVRLRALEMAIRLQAAADFALSGQARRSELIGAAIGDAQIGVHLWARVVDAGHASGAQCRRCWQRTGRARCAPAVRRDWMRVVVHGRTAAGRQQVRHDEARGNDREQA